jgi:hypothetical protein
MSKKTQNDSAHQRTRPQTDLGNAFIFPFIITRPPNMVKRKLSQTISFFGLYSCRLFTLSYGRPRAESVQSDRLQRPLHHRRLRSHGLQVEASDGSEENGDCSGKEDQIRFELRIGGALTCDEDQMYACICIKACRVGILGNRSGFDSGLSLALVRV